MVERIGKYLCNGITAVSVLGLLWFLFSWIDVILHNLDPNPVYQCWNLFVLLLK
jgi:hypothetical protein